jgi:hypothetical protein
MQPVAADEREGRRQECAAGGACAVGDERREFVHFQPEKGSAEHERQRLAAVEQAALGRRGAGAPIIAMPQMKFDMVMSLISPIQNP